MTHDMAQTPQPGFLSAWVSAFTSFDQAHGFAVNLFAVVALALIGAAFLTGQRRLVRPALIAFTVLCLADWVLIEDFGFFGGLGTDPNSMIPFALLAVSGYLALAPAAVTAAAEASRPYRTRAVPAGCPAAPAAGWRDRVRPASLRRGVAAASFRHDRLARRARADHPRRGADGRRPGQPERRPDPGRIDRRVERAAELPAPRPSSSPTSTARR